MVNAGASLSETELINGTSTARNPIYCALKLTGFAELGGSDCGEVYRLA